jgi:cytochrome c oxidase subunit 3
MAVEAVRPARAHQFEDADQQSAASSLGMWAFLATEIMFFGGLFAGYGLPFTFSSCVRGR